MKRGHRIFVGMLLMWATMAAPALEPGYRPPPDSDEAALWHFFGKGERVLQLSPLRIRDAALENYLKTVVCKLTPRHCNDIRIYITRNPEFNASMSANGALHIWSGVLLRMRNEAQLAALLGHEIAHFLRRDALKQWRSAKQTGVLAELLSFGISPVGELISGGLFATLLPFSQRQEIEADDHGLQMMLSAGYDASQAPLIWADFAAEQRVANLGATGALVLSTHPGSASRAARLRRHIAAKSTAQGTTGVQTYARVMTDWYPTFLRDQLKSYQPERTRHILDRLKGGHMSRGDWLYFDAELQRQIGGPQRLAAARSRYRQSIAAGGPAVALRDLGYTELRLNERAAAMRSLQRYLQRAPDAHDRATVQAFLRGIM